jgi:hypothetical protein
LLLSYPYFTAPEQDPGIGEPPLGNAEAVQVENQELKGQLVEVQRRIDEPEKH